MNGNELLKELSEGLEAIFGPAVVFPRELPRCIKESKALLISLLYPAVSIDKRKITRRAAVHLFPLLKELKYLPEDFQSDDEMFNSSFAHIISIFRVWAAMLDDEFQTLVRAIALNRPALLDKFIDYPGAAPVIDRDQARLNIAWDIVTRIHYLHRAMIRREVATPAERMNRREMTGIVEQFKKVNPEGPFYDESHHLHIRVNPEHDIESIVSAVRKIVEDKHAAIREETRQCEGEEYIPKMDPVKEFTFKEPGSKGRTEQSFIDDAFHALLIYELRLKRIQKVDIERRFFGLQGDSTTGAYNTATSTNTRLNRLAKRIISNTLAGVALQY